METMNLSSNSLDPSMPMVDDEIVVIPLKISWPKKLSEIYIPSHNLSSNESDKNENSNCQEFNRSTFHSLQKENIFQKIHSFAIYVDSQEDEEIFQSDSDNDFLSSDISSDNVEPLNSDSQNNIPCDFNNLLVNADAEKLLNSAFVDSESNVLKNSQTLLLESFAQKSSIDPALSQNLDKGQNNETKTIYEDTFKSNVPCNRYNTDEIENVNIISNASGSQTSLTEILDTALDVNLKNFTFNYKKKDLAELESESNKLKDRRNLKKQKKLKKKAAKYIQLDDFGNVRNGQMFINESLADRRMHDFIQGIISNQNVHSDCLQIHDSSEFPGLAEEIKLIKSENSSVGKPPNNSSTSMKDVTDILSVKNKDATLEEKECVLETKSSKCFQRIIIENLPKNVNKDDIMSLLSGFGDIQNLKCFFKGQYLKVIFEVNPESTNIDWMIECLHGTDPFGANSQTLKCYKA